MTGEQKLLLALVCTCIALLVTVGAGAILIFGCQFALNYASEKEFALSFIIFVVTIIACIPLSVITLGFWKSARQAWHDCME